MKHYRSSALALCAVSMFTLPALAQQLPPADAKPGECYAKVLIPASYRTTPEEVMVQPASSSFKKTPAIYRDVEKEVLIEEESFELVAVPPVYENVSETILVQPEQVVKSVVPATYRTEEKRVLISPARMEWKVGRGPHEKLDAATGEIMCRVEIPAVFKTYEQQVIDQPAQTREEVVPAQYVTVQRKKMVTPPTTQRRVIPAKYKTIKIKELVAPEKFEVNETPARFASIQKRTLINSESVQWRQILCETNTTQEVVKRIQNALISAGYKLGFEPDGELGAGTQAIIRKFQEDNNLPTGGLTISTINKLGVSL
ncbi:peptidoglycan-binding protein [Ahrensia sp. R2A130]|uniref:peptidoglycan-binding domain-containing protein n=1 Tax=Ahrensia sp. R2A130 TaxID=744979 RepID=UPI0001E0F89D|nr:peptidoglycan-binding domain-containing protein [Ahrensia sp. R2A130]EFL89034.1 putative peptidoglycan binding domain protein [Ahrensia sp. R2A130]